MAEVVTVRRNNEVLKIAAYLVPSYLELGYDVIGEGGRVVQRAVPTDPVQLKAEFVKKEAEIESLKKEIKSLEKEIEALNQKLTEATTPVKEKKSGKSKKSDAE